MIMMLLVLLVSGCAQTVSDSYCDLSQTFWLKDSSVIDQLSLSDPDLLREIVKHNKTYSAVCHDT